MLNQKGIRVAEYVRRGHPDRMADIIADTLLDEFLKQDPDSRVALEVMGCSSAITIGGELSTKGNVDIPRIVRRVYKSIGYKNEISVRTIISKQSTEIKDLADVGAGDSGIVTGYATNETSEFLPKEVVLAKKIVGELDGLDYLMPDGKVQVTLENSEFKKLVVSVQGEPSVESKLREFLNDRYPEPELFLTVFKNGGFEADTGLTGRKNVLWYGPRVPIGGGAFAGKDATKVDRSGAYWARKMAVEMVKKDGYEKCLIEIAFIIGQDSPISCTANGEKINTVNVSSMIEELKLKKPLFKMASLNGHFGYPGCPWE